MLYKFKPGRNAAEAKGESAVNHSREIRWFTWVAKTLTISQNLSLESLLQSIEANLVSSSWSISQFISPPPPPMSVLDMTNYLMVRLQSLSFEECRIPFHYHYSQVHSDPEL